MRRRSLRHPFGRGRFYVRAPARRGRPSGGRRWPGRSRAHAPHMRPRRSVNVAALVASPEDVPSRPRLRIRIIAAVVLALFGVMVLRLWTLQVIDRHVYAAAVNTNALRSVTVPAPRGLIVDRRGTVLAGNTVENEIVLSRNEAHQDPSIVGKVAALAGVAPKTIQAALTDQQYSPYDPVPVLQNASPATVQYLDAHQAEFPGVTVEQVTVRSYPQGGTTATQVLGYVGPITGTELSAHPHAGYTLSSQIGKTGIEAEYEPYLRGKAGRKTLMVTATGTVVGTLRQTRPTQGDTVVLNVTAGLQEDVQSALAADIAHDRSTPTSGTYPRATNGAAVVLDAQTGAVLALTSYPSYSLTEWIGGISTANYAALQAGCNSSTGGCPLNNYAIQGLYTPGSTFKLATATAALQDGIITPTSTRDDTGVFDLRTHGDPTCTSGCSFHDATAADAGVITVRLAITESDDFFFYTMGWQFYRDGHPTGIQQVANEYGFGELTNIDLPGEIQGRVDGPTERAKLHKATPKNFPNTYWYAGTSIEMAFGQGGTVITPIEEAQAYATFADHGVKHQPEVAGAIATPVGRIVKRIAPRVTGHVAISTANYQAMLQGFIGATHTPKGTAYYTFQQDSHVPSSYVIAGKTGTATTATSSATRAPNAWFVGFGPVGAATQYVVVVEVAQGGYGEAAAAPAVANIFNYLYANPPPASLGIPTSRNQPSTILPPANPPVGTPTTTPATTAPATTTTTTATSGTTTTTVPSSAGAVGTPTSPATTGAGTTPAGGTASGTAGNAPLAGAAAGSRAGSGSAARAAVTGFPRAPP